jgi:serine/threonine protein kinase
LTDDFLSLVKKQILKAGLQGIVELHDRDIVHLGNKFASHFRDGLTHPQLTVSDIKPDNILINCSHHDTETSVEQVQISDFENAAYLPKGRRIKGMLAGNDNWRCPEGHFKGELNKPSHMYSSRVVVGLSMLIANLVANMLSVSTRCLGVSYSDLMTISENMNRRVHCLRLFVCGVRSRISGLRMG